MHARPAHTYTHQPRNIQTGMHNKGKSLWAPQLISCMEIIFKTEQNGGPSLGGRVGLHRAPGAGWHVTVYACLLNKRCWPRWKSAIGHLICPTCVIGSCPNTQYCIRPINRERRVSRKLLFTGLHRNFKIDAIMRGMYHIYSSRITLSGSFL